MPFSLKKLLVAYRCHSPQCTWVMIFSTKDGRAANQIWNGDWMQDQTKTNFPTFKLALNPIYRICLNFAKHCISSCYQNSIIGQKFTVPFLKYKRLRVNVTKNQRKFQKCGHGQKSDFAQTLSV